MAIIYQLNIREIAKLVPSDSEGSAFAAAPRNDNADFWLNGVFIIQ